MGSNSILKTNTYFLFWDLDNFVMEMPIYYLSGSLSESISLPVRVSVCSSVRRDLRN